MELNSYSYRSSKY